MSTIEKFPEKILFLLCSKNFYSIFPPLFLYGWGNHKTKKKKTHQTIKLNVLALQKKTKVKHTYVTMSTEKIKCENRTK